MIHIVKDNVELIINEMEYEKYLKMGFKTLDIVKSEFDDVEKRTPLSKMKLDDLKVLAEELNLESDGLNCDELRKIIKDAQS